MADHNIQIAVDSRKAQTGVKQFAGSLNDALKALRKFDAASKGAFSQLDKLGKVNLGSLQKTARGTAQALDTLNRVKVSKALVTNLQTLQQTLRNFRFNVSAIKAVPDALNALNRIRIDSRLPTALNEIKASLVGFRGPPKGAVDNLIRLAQGIALVNPGRIEAAANALAKLNGFKFSAPRGGIGNLGNVRGVQSQIGGLTTSLSYLRTALAGVSTAVLARGIYQTGNAFQTLARTLGAVATSSDEVASQMKFLTQLTGRMPVSLEAVASSYGKFAIAARLSGVTVEETQKTFEGFATAFSAMGVGADAQKRGFEALIQMFSKGKIQAEEIRQQLAEALPGAMTLLAESMGVTTAQLSKMLDEGKVMATELPAMANLLSERFGPSVEIAMQRASAQLTNLGNAWTNTKNIVYNSGFEAAIASSAKTMTEALNSDTVKNFAAGLGRVLGNAAIYASAFFKTVTSDIDRLNSAFRILLAIGITAVARGLRMMLAPALAIAWAGLRSLAKAATFAHSRLLLIPAALTIAAVAVDQFVNDGKATEWVLRKLAAAASTVGAGLSKAFDGLIGTSLDGLGDDFAKNLRDAEETAMRFQDSPLFDPNAIARNGRLEADNAAKKLATLTDAEQAVWDEVNAIGKANSEYLEQLALLDAIAAKKGIDAGPWKKALAARTLDDRNPAGALARDYRADLANLSAKTGEQRALNAAQADYNALLSQGQDIGAAGLDALKQYHTAIARLNGEIGNGFERWATTVGDWNDQMNDAIADGIGGLSDEITNFVTGAEADFAGLARSILRTFVKISLDSLLKDLFGAFGMDPAKQSTSMADAALAKLASIGDNITTAMTNVYTTGLSINGTPIADVLADPSRITRAPLADIPGTNVMPNTPSVNDRFPLEGTVPGLRGSLGINGADLKPYIDPNINPERFGYPPATARASHPFLDLIGRAEGTDKGRGYNETLAYGAFTGGNQNLTGMTLNQIDALQGKMLAHPGNIYDSSALGRYQIVRKTMRGLRGEMGLSGNEMFDEGMQDQMALRLMQRRGNSVAGLRNEWEGLRRVDASTITNTYGQGGIDPATTGSIDALNAKLQTIGTTAASTAPAFDTMRAANQNLATVSTTAGINVQTAGTMASMAGPQFTTAGTSIEAAGQKASMAATQAAPALDGMGNGISQLLGPLASAIPGLGQFGSMIMQLASSLFSGGGIGGGLFSEGGYSTSPVARASLPAGFWSNAPHFAEGTANTSGGMPAVLHPNEAVIPLTRGREVPVDLGNDNRRDDRDDNRRGPISVNQTFVVKDADSFRRSKREIQVQTMSAMQRAQIRA